MINSYAKIHTVFLLALQAPRFKAAEYTVLTEEWRRLKDEGYPEHLIKKEDAKRTREIDAALKRTVLPHNTAAFLQSQCKWVCHQMELRIVLVGKVMEEPLFNGQIQPHLLVTVRNAVAARYCFHRRLSFCPQGGVWQISPGRHPYGQTPTSPGQTPPSPQADIP